MAIKHIAIIACLLFLMETKQLFQIQERFIERSAQIEKLPLPEKLSQTSLQQELSQYAQTHQSKQFQNFSADPEYSSQILLKKDGVWNQSIYFAGRQFNNLLMEITIIHKGDNHNHDKDAITVYLINTATGEFLFAGLIKHMRLFKYEIESELYELRVGFDWSKEIERNISSQEEVLKHIAINIDIDPIVHEEQAKQKDEEAAQAKLRTIKNETDRIFMSSLEIWQQIHNQHNQFFRVQEKAYFRAYLQLFVVFLANIIEWVLLRRTLKIKTLI